LKKLTIRTNVRAGASTSQLQDLATDAYIRAMADRLRNLGGTSNTDLRSLGG